MSSTEHILYLLELPERHGDDWSLRVDLDAYSPDALMRLGSRCSSQASDPTRVRKALMQHLEGEIDARSTERILEDEGVLDALVLEADERRVAERPSPAPEGAKGIGGLRLAVNGLSNGVCDYADSTLRTMSWLGHRPVTALAVWLLGLLGLGLGLTRLVRLGLGGLGLS